MRGFSLKWLQLSKGLPGQSSNRLLLQMSRFSAYRTPQGGHPYKRHGGARRKFWKEPRRGTNSYITHDLLRVSLTAWAYWQCPQIFNKYQNRLFYTWKGAMSTPVILIWESPPRMSTCQPVYWRWVLCEVCLHFITWLLSWVCRWFIRVHLPKLLFSTFDDQNNLYSAIKRSTQRWTVFFVDNAFHFVLCNFFYSEFEF